MSYDKQGLDVTFMNDDKTVAVNLWTDGVNPEATVTITTRDRPELVWGPPETLNEIPKDEDE